MTNVILSTTLLLEEGRFQNTKISMAEAIEWVKTQSPINFCGHETVKVLGLEPTKTRDVCAGYDQALCLKPNGRMEFGREYSVQEILDVGVSFNLITRID